MCETCLSQSASIRGIKSSSVTHARQAWGWEWARGQVCRLPFPVTTLGTIHTCMRLLSPPHLDGFQLHAKAVVFWQQVPVPGFNLLQLCLQFSFIFSASLLEFSEFLLRVLCPTEFPDVSWSFTERLHAAVIHVSALYSTAFWGRNCHCPHYTDEKMRWLVSRSSKSNRAWACPQVCLTP